MMHLVKYDYVKYAICFILGYYVRGIIKFVKRKKKNIFINVKVVLYSKIRSLFCSYLISSYEKNLVKIEKDLFYKNYDRETIEKHGKYINIYDMPSDAFEKISQTKILIIGIGGLGSPLCLYLSKFTFKEIGLVDGDKVEESNLHRQIIHKKKNVGLNKTISAKLTVEDIDRDSNNIKCYPFYFDKIKGLDLIKKYDIIIDCTDNISTRFLINDICVLYKKKLIFGSALGLYGQLNVFNMSENSSNCYRCIKNFNNHTEGNDCDENGILSTVTGVIGLLQANEVIKLSTGLHKETLKNFLTYNSFSNVKPFETLNINKKNKNCICSSHNFKELYNFILNNNYPNNNDTECKKINTSSYKYDIDVFNFLDILNKNFSFFEFPIDHLCILDVRKYNNTNVYGLRNSIKWSYCDIMESISYYAGGSNADNRGNDPNALNSGNTAITTNNMNKLVKIILDKLEISLLKGNIVIIVICRRGIDSLKITKYFNKFFLGEKNNSFSCADKATPVFSSFDNKLKYFNEEEKIGTYNFPNKNIFTYNMKGGYIELQKKIFKNLPFL
ncbi:adenylyltransferase and sulfurtransferase UBA4 [Plasmodium brasilianum]|uniref:Ubiquitin-activating enzyme, putative n=2 Tax=Plasmodium (Plasmodium) TaxID=418103 RepID=A0A1A8W6A8_PLAMA|nr:ubiquitin-activating enzyme, putative [Plasmodium malariae]KAI4837077.1 adenylyltransferase and sulfurtransferase UBA4 [Plasmodium brasilianum]SBS86683.1 ubiquitin-activating enzyme, putative [Plasmodium malariae]SCO92957.1 ubiquitin-activating enzyme, putative [Plasmodium malariae]